MAELLKTDIGKDRLGKAKDRLDANIAELIEEVTDGLNHPKDTSVEEQQTQGDMPSASADVEDEGMSQGTNARAPARGTRGTTEIYIGTPDRPRIVKRRSDPDEMEEDVNKVRKFHS